MFLLYEIFKLSLKSLKANKLRSSLSMLGIVIWVFTIILVIAIWNTVSKAIEDQFKFLNVTTIVAQPVNTSIAKSKLNNRDLKYILKNTKYIKTWTQIFFWRWTVIYKDKKKQYNILAWNENFPIAMPLWVDLWFFFNESQAIKWEKVVIIWKVIVDDIFWLWSNPIWKEILVSWKIFKIIWTLKSSGWIWPFSFDDSLIMPIETTNKFLSSENDAKPMIFLANDVNDVENALEELKIFLRKLHNIKPWNDDDFALRDQWKILILAKWVASITKYLLVWVWSIVLIVSWIWIMNVMFAWVAERKKEIWVMMSIWARKKDILNQFIIESLVLTIFAWTIWVVLWSLVLYLFNLFSPYKVVNAFSWIVLAVWFALATWVFFWIYPARKASNMDPVDALK